MQTFNIIGLIFVLGLIFPETLYYFSLKKQGKLKYIDFKNKKQIFIIAYAVKLVCFILMIINIPGLYKGFFFDMGNIYYYAINISLVLLNIQAWVKFWDKFLKVRTYFVTILAIGVFIYSGIMLRYVLLIVMGVLFMITNIYLSIKIASVITSVINNVSTSEENEIRS